MNTVFIGGSRHITRLPEPIQNRLSNVIQEDLKVLVGDAAGADKAIQKFLSDACYERVTVFCSGDAPRNNVGQWPTHNVHPPKAAKGFQFYAAKDREMAQQADLGLMIWDGKSPGTILNVLRLVRAGKKCVLMDVAAQKNTTFNTATKWDTFLTTCSQEVIKELRERATPEEWDPPKQAPLFTSSEPVQEKSEQELANELNVALASGDTAKILEALGQIAKVRGMSQIAKESGLARESLYRSLHAEGNPEFATVLKVMA